MITQQECENLILKLYQQDKSQIDSLSYLQKNARWKNKDTCFSYFWKSSMNLREFLEHPEQYNNEQQHNAATNTNTNELEQATNQTQVATNNQSWKQSWWFFNILLLIFLWIILLLVL